MDSNLGGVDSNLGEGNGSDNGSSEIIPKKTSIIASTTVARGDYLKVYLKDSEGLAVSGALLSIKINGKSYSVTTKSNGLAQLKISLTAGKYYTATVKYAGNDYYLGLSKSFKTKIVKTSTNINVKSTTVVRGNYLYVILKDKNSKLLANKKVYITFNKKSFTKTTNSNGIAYLKINSQATKTYKVNLSYKGDASYYASSKSLSVKVVKTSTVLSVKSTEVVKGDYLVVYLKTKDGKVLPNGKVSIKINGKTYTKTTNSKGFVSLKISTLSIKNYTVNLSYKGSASYYASSKSLSVKVVKTSTVLSVKSTEVAKGDYLVVYLKTKDGKALSNGKVSIKINGNTFTKTTNSNGEVSLLILTLTPGETYSTTIKYDGSSSYGSSTKNVDIKINKSNQDLNYSIWVWGSSLDNVDYNAFCENLSLYGINNIFLLVKEETINTKLPDLIAAGQPYNIKVHAWIKVFYNNSWIHPILEDGSLNQKVFDDRIEFAKKIAQIEGIGGIQLDYLRDPSVSYYGNKDKINAITEFARQFSVAIKEINPDIVLSAAVMPEINKYNSAMTVNEYYYGQNITALAKYLDVICPMVYKGNYNQNSTWIKSTTEKFKSAVNGNAEIWVGLQGYRSDDDTTILSISELTEDCSNALYGGADGIVLFKYTSTNILDLS